ncbi:hypothetical protein [Polyangium aurulentum]|uniref:hypothetical protein n=1 Tax=Polyangium aurulentum TaxID=2567896 RepID=UPI00146EF25A|nr:hypothetical protein [Polyangium aurulentum]UQA63116.1 hypothetical protein E8A73_022695 [Polyangium aurulentum]
MPLRRTMILAGTSLATALLCGCGHDWDAYDPRHGADGAGAGGVSSSGIGGSNGSSGSGVGGSGAGGGSASSSGSGGGATCELSLQNDFEDGVVVTPPWVEYHSDGVMPEEASGDLFFHLPSMSTESVWGVLATDTSHNLSGCAISAQVRQVPSTATDAYTNLALGIDNDNYVEIVSHKGQLMFKAVINGNGEPPLESITHDLGLNAFWRISEKDGITTWETSPDGENWDFQVSAPNPLPVDGMVVKIGTGTLTAVTQSLQPARWDNLKITDAP